ncbi:MAG: UDP-N-acetylglucosamine--N-acetylmuramyl-(pentapeptide) pyrophosphoryl-undecaprenol N-acetylglucosamine transferase [Anaerolineae bacterium]|nr:UDP-N-acetylglucosamine--N-acetylmuramyl-(pentapeptide) pyrophosphoryl-undecaprenol N-acetylglucosamine transferase [Anaerolineae bacterium]
MYPALTVIETLLDPGAGQAAMPALKPQDLLWVGSRGGMEQDLVGRAGIEFEGLPAGGIRGMGLLTGMRNSLHILKSVGTARRILAQFGTDVVLITGGYASVSVGLAAWLKRVPIVIYLPDIVPGMAISYLSRLATRVAVTSEESYRFFSRDKVVVTGYPVRAEVYTLSRQEARQALGLEQDVKTLLVFGGSRGARSINRAVVSGLRELLPKCQVVHVTGQLDASWVTGAAKSLPEDLQARYHQFDYLHDMPRALVAADLVVARAGAATLGEFPAAGLPALLVPYPHSGQHQLPNATYMARSGAAEVLPDAALDEDLVPRVSALLEDEAKLDGMRQSARAMARSDAAEMIAELLWTVRRQRSSRDPAGGVA